MVAVGVDGTDDELVLGTYGEAPDDEDRLVIGHECLGRVLQPAGGLEAGQLVAAIVRRPDPVPCLNCAAGEWDKCLNGRHTERGIKGRHGFLAERYGETDTDAALLTLPSIGYLDGNDPAMAATIEAAYAQLSIEGAIHPIVAAEIPAPGPATTTTPTTGSGPCATSGAVACSPRCSTRPPAPSSATPPRPSPTSA